MSPDVSATFVHQDLYDCLRSSTYIRAGRCTPPSGSRPSWERAASPTAGRRRTAWRSAPKDIPLVDSIAAMGRATTKHMLFGWLLK